jgi:hypothetical protein
MSDTENNTSMDSIVNSLKSFEAPELFKILKTVISEVEKKSKHTAKSTTTAKTSTTTKKSGSMPKGTIPPQLKKPRAWVEYTLRDALANGWESFTVIQTTKNKETGTKTEEQIEMPASILHNGAYVFDGSVTKDHPTGKQPIHKDAMSLSKQRKESGHPTHAEFEAQYVDDTTDDDKSVTSNTSSKIVVKKTAAEKEAEKAAAKAAKEAEKAAVKAAKEAEKAAAKAAKEAEKASAKAEKEAEKIVTKPVVPASAVKKITQIKPVEVTQVKTDGAVAPKKKPSAKVEEIPNDGMVHPWTHGGKKYLRNSDGETWTVGADGGVGNWVGLYNTTTNKIDTSASEPIYEDDE